MHLPIFDVLRPFRQFRLDDIKKELSMKDKSKTVVRGSLFTTILTNFRIGWRLALVILHLVGFIQKILKVIKEWL
jgi:hypothetical protein